MSDTSNPNVKIMFLPGNGCTSVRNSNWYGWLASKLEEKFPDAKVICEDFPDPYKARESFWVPFVKEKMGEPHRETSLDAAGAAAEAPSSSASASTSRVFLVGHSSGSVCIMRLLETYKVDGAFLVSGCVTDLGEESERVSGYYPTQPDGSNRPWRWDRMRQNAGRIVHIGSSDDCFIPVEQMREIKRNLELEEGSTYFEFDDQSHFMVGKSPELLRIIGKGIEDILKSP